MLLFQPAPAQREQAKGEKRERTVNVIEGAHDESRSHAGQGRARHHAAHQQTCELVLLSPLSASRPPGPRRALSSHTLQRERPVRAGLGAIGTPDAK